MSRLEPKAEDNRLLAALAPEDRALLDPMMARVPLAMASVLVEANAPVRHAVFPLSGVVSALADAEEVRIEVGMVGREGFVGVPVVLGTDRSPHMFVVQGAGEALRIAVGDLRAALAARPSIFRPLGLYTQAFIVQITQTASVNATFGIEARLARWLLMMQDRTGTDDLTLTHEFLSCMLGVRRPGVTTATHVLERIGAVRAQRGRITIEDRAKLKDIAGDSYDAAEREYERLMAGA